MQIDLENPYDIDFKFCINHSFSRSYSCKSSGCKEEGICRCSKVIDFKMDSVEMSKLPQIIYSRYFIEDDMEDYQVRDLKLEKLIWGGNVNMYCIDRIARKMQLWDINKYEPKISHGWYGQEFDGIYLKQDLELELKQHLSMFIYSKSVKEKIDYALQFEYNGELIDSVKNSDYDITTISIEEIDFSGINQKHIQNIHGCGKLEYYSPDNYRLPRGIVKKIGNKYRILDGYHRIINSSLYGVDKLNVFITNES